VIEVEAVFQSKRKHADNWTEVKKARESAPPKLRKYAEC